MANSRVRMSCLRYQLCSISWIDDDPRAMRCTSPGRSPTQGWVLGPRMILERVIVKMRSNQLVNSVVASVSVRMYVRAST